jgi:1-acyl-sn-glycerol-3-phosphate acyltransferase
VNTPDRVLTGRQPMGLLYWLGWSFFRLLFAAYFRWRYFHPERVPRSGPVILASNHASYLDPPLVGSTVSRPLNYLARDTLFRFPLMGWLLRRWHAVPIDREGGGAAGLRKILEVLNAKQAVILFPEGTRTRDGQLQQARSGIGLMVLKSGAPVVPVRVFGTYEAYGRSARFPKPRPVVVKFGAPLHFEVLRQEAQSCSKARLKEIYQQIADEIMTAIAGLEPRPDGALPES